MNKKKQQPEMKAESSKLSQHTKQSIDSPPVIRSKDIVNVWIDRTEIRIRNDGLGLVSLFADIPTDDGASSMEVFRFMNSKGHLEQLVNAICRAIDYWPEKPEKEIN